MRSESDIHSTSARTAQAFRVQGGKAKGCAHTYTHTVPRTEYILYLVRPLSYVHMMQPALTAGVLHPGPASVTPRSSGASLASCSAPCSRASGRAATQAYAAPARSASNTTTPGTSRPRSSTPSSSSHCSCRCCRGSPLAPCARLLLAPHATGPPVAGVNVAPAQYLILYLPTTISRARGARRAPADCDNGHEHHEHFSVRTNVVACGWGGVHPRKFLETAE